MYGHIYIGSRSNKFLHILIDISLKRKQIMGGAKGVIVLLVLSFHFCNSASLCPLGQTLPMGIFHFLDSVFFFFFLVFSLFMYLRGCLYINQKKS